MSTVIPSHQLLEHMLGVQPSLPGHPANVLSPSAFRSGLPPAVSIADYERAVAVNAPFYSRLQTEQYQRMLMGVTDKSADIAREIGMSKKDVEAARRSVNEALGMGDVDPVVNMVGSAMARTKTMQSIMGGDIDAMTKRIYSGAQERTRGPIVAPNQAKDKTLGGYKQRLARANEDVGSFVGAVIHDEIFKGGVTPDHRVLQGFSLEDVVDMGWQSTDRMGGFIEAVAKATGEGSGGTTDAERAMQKELSGDLRDQLKRTTDFMSALGDMVGSRDMDELRQALKDFGAADIDPTDMPDLQEVFRKTDALAQYFNMGKDLSANIQRTTVAAMRSAMGVTADHLGAGLDGGGMIGPDATLELTTRSYAAAEAAGVKTAAGRAEYVANQTALYGRITDSTAGRATRMIMSAKEAGLVADDDFKEFEEAMGSGDLDRRDRVIDRILTQRYGSVAEARSRMQDDDYMAYVDQGISRAGGVDVQKLLFKGDRAELNKRAIRTQQTQFNRRVQGRVSELGLTLDADTESKTRTDAMLANLAGQGEGAAAGAAALSSDVAAMRAAGESEQRIQSHIAGRLQSGAFKEYSAGAFRAADDAVGKANMARLEASGGEASAVIAALDEMRGVEGVLEMGEYAEVLGMLKDDPSGAAARIDAIMGDDARWSGDATGANRKFIRETMDKQRKGAGRDINTLKAQTAATATLQTAWDKGIGATQALEDVGHIVDGIVGLQVAAADGESPKKLGRRRLAFSRLVGDMEWMSKEDVAELEKATSGDDPEFTKSVLLKYQQMQGMARGAVGDVKKSTGATHTEIKATEAGAIGEEERKRLNLDKEITNAGRHAQGAHDNAGGTPESPDPRASWWQRAVSKAPEWAGKAAGVGKSVLGVALDAGRTVRGMVMPGVGGGSQKITGELRIIDTDGVARKATMTGTAK